MDKRIVKGFVVLGVLSTVAFGANEITKERPNVRDFNEAKLKAEQSIGTSTEYVITEDTDMRTKLYLYDNVQRTGKGTVKIIK